MFIAKMKLKRTESILDIDKLKCMSCKRDFFINVHRKAKGAEIKCPWCGQIHINQAEKSFKLEKA